MAQLMTKLSSAVQTISKFPYQTIFRMSSSSAPVESTIIDKLNQEFQPHHMQVVNESYMHNVPAGSETHFKVLIVSDKFSGQSLIERHRKVNQILDEELKSGVHALSIVAKTMEQWEKMEKKSIDPSPNCRGGFGK